MFQIIIRTFLIYIFIFAAVKLMGKHELAELHPFELVVLLIISDMASIAMQDAGVPLLSSLVPIITLTVLEIALSVMTIKSPRLRRIVNGAPSVLIANGKINQSELSRLRMSIEDLAEELRSLGFFGIADVEYAVMETDGQVNAIPKSAKAPLTQQDMQLHRPQEKPAVTIISDGVLSEQALDQINKDRRWLEKELEKRHIKKISDIFIAEFAEGQLQIQRKTDNKSGQ